MAGCESSISSKDVSPKILSSSINCFMYAPWVAALHAQIVSASVLERATSGVCPDFEQTHPWPLLRKKNHPPVLLEDDSSSACDESQNAKKTNFIPYFTVESLKNFSPQFFCRI